METVAGEKPLRFATSLIVTASDLLDERFTGLFVAASSGISLFDCNGTLFTAVYSAGTSNDMIFRKPEVFQAPQISPTAIHTEPSTFAGKLRFHQMYAQIPKPSTRHSKIHAVFFSSRMK